MLYIFDLGNVIVDIDFNRVLGAWSDLTRIPLATLKKSFHMGEAFHQHERGEISDEAFAEALCHEMALPLSYEQFSHGWQAVFVALRPEVIAIMHKLREHGIRIGSTTGYTHAMMDVVEKEAAAKGYHPDLLVTPEDVDGNGRPKPYMIFRNMQLLQAEDIRKVMKVGDTASDMKEGKDAGVYTVGVLEGSSALGMSQEEFEGLTGQEQQKELDRAKKILMDAGADRVIRSLKELPHIIFS